MKILRSENGNTLLIAIFILVFAAIIGLSLMTMTINGTTKNETREDMNQATEQAEKGITHISTAIQKKIESKVPPNSVGSSNTLKQNFENELSNIFKSYNCDEGTPINSGNSDLNYTVCLESVTEKDNTKTLTFRSIGYADGKTKTIRSAFEFSTELKNYPEVLKYAVATHSEGNLILNGGIDIKGNVLADGNIIVSKYGYAPIVDKEGSIFKDFKLNFSPWKKTVYPKIEENPSKSSLLKVNTSKNLFHMNVTDFNGKCKRPSYLNNIFTNLNFEVPEYLTYYDLINYNFNSITDTTKCLFGITNPTEISPYLSGNNKPIIEPTLIQQSVNINEIINAGKVKLSSVIKNSYPKELWLYRSHTAEDPTELKAMNDLAYLTRVTLNGEYKTSAIAAALNKSTLNGDFYFDKADLKLGESITKSSENILNGRFYFNKTNLGAQSNLKIYGGKQTLNGEFYFEKTSTNANGKGLLNKLKDGFDNAIEIDNGTHTIQGIYYVNGDMQIKSSTIKANAIFYVNGDVQIEHSTIESLNGGKLIIFATGDISYEYASDYGANIGKKYYNDKPLELNAFLYSNKKIELHGTLSNIHLKGGVAAKQVLLSGVRGSVKNQVGIEFTNTQDLNAGSRLKIEYDDNVIKTIQEISNNYSSDVTYNEFVVTPLKQISRQFQ